MRYFDLMAIIVPTNCLNIYNVLVRQVWQSLSCSIPSIPWTRVQKVYVKIVKHILRTHMFYNFVALFEAGNIHLGKTLLSLRHWYMAKLLISLLDLAQEAPSILILLKCSIQLPRSSRSKTIGVCIFWGWRMIQTPTNDPWKFREDPRVSQTKTFIQKRQVLKSSDNSAPTSP